MGMEVKKNMQHKKFDLVTLIIVTISMGIAGFFWGLLYQKNKGIKSQMGEMGRQVRGMTKQRSGFQGKQSVSGEVVSVDENTITVKTSDGGSKVIVYTNDIKVDKTTEGAIADVVTGTNITTFGSESNGTVVAERISVGVSVPQGREGAQPPPKTQ